MKTITVAHLKGGTSKTTTAGFLAHALQNMGKSVLVIDADPQGSLLRWSRRGKWDIPVRHVPSRHVDEEIAGMWTDDFDFIIIDTPPQYDVVANAEIIRSAMRAAEIIIVPTSPLPAEIERVKATFAAAEAEGIRDRVRILLTRAPGVGPDAKDARDAMTAAGRFVMDSEIRPRIAVGRITSGASRPSDSRGFAGYTGVALELLK